MKKKKHKSRFKIVLDEPDGLGSGTRLIEDRETGIVYLYYYGGGGAGLTVLLDEEGNPTITPTK